MGAQAAVRGVRPPLPSHSDGTGWIHSFCFEFLNSNSNSLIVKKLNSNSMTLKKLNSNSNSLILQKSNSNLSIIREQIQIQNSKFKFNSILVMANLSIIRERIQIQNSNFKFNSILVMAIVIHPSNFFGTNRIRITVTLLITRKNSGKTKVRGKCANAIHRLERSIIGHPLSVPVA